jgi:predicted tellurium resistance membrane protein TerC
MAILMFINLVANLVNKLWWLSYVGSAVIIYTGAMMIFEDPFVHKRLDWGGFIEHGVAIVLICNPGICTLVSSSSRKE